MGDKLDTYACTLLWDFDRYVKLANFSDVRLFLIEMRKKGYQYEDILAEVQARQLVDYSPNYLASIISTEVPKRIALIAKKHRLLTTAPPNKRKECIHCGRSLPADPLFFSRNNARADGLSNTCKECDKESRLRRGIIDDVDRRKKD